MKRILALLAAALFALSAVGCACQNTASSEQSLPQSSTASSAESRPTYADDAAFLRANLPRMDGSTSLIPLEAGVRAALFDISVEEATGSVAHTTTYGAYNNLMEGNCDLIFSTPLSERQKAAALSVGATLNCTAIAAEGFVFVVNAQNPVDALTQQQLKDIYAGRITNWKDVGGSDAPIIAYQRNSDSGSQNYMTDFMSGDTLMDAPIELRPDSMTGLMDVIALNDNSVDAIGYSVYAYAADMYGNGNEIKFIKVDGVEPNKQTMAAGKYPLMNYNYAIYNSAASDESSGAARMVSWLCSYDGQLAIAKAGYVTVTDIGFNYTEMTVEKYAALGTGGKTVSDLSEKGYTWTSVYDKTIGGNLAVADNLPEVTPNAYNQYIGTLCTDVTYSVPALEGTALGKAVEKWLDAAVTRSRDRYGEIEHFLSTYNTEWDAYSPFSAVQYSSSSPMVYTKADVQVRNGYLCAAVYTGYSYNVMDGYERYVGAESAFFDTRTGKRVEYADLFYDGVNIAELLGKKVVSGVHFLTSQALAPAIELKTDFAGMPATDWALTFDGVVFGSHNPYFSAGMTVPAEFTEAEVKWLQPRDMSGELGTADCTRQLRSTYSWNSQRAVYRKTENGLGSYALLDETVGGNTSARAAINAVITKAAEKSAEFEPIRKYFADRGITIAEGGVAYLDWYLIEYYGKFVVVWQPVAEVFTDTNDYSYPEDGHMKAYCYSLKNGEPMKLTELLADGWRDHVKGGSVTEAAFPDTMPVTSAQAIWEDGSVRIQLCLYEDNGETAQLSVDPAYLIWD